MTVNFYSLNILLDNPSDHKIALTISPLKLLQTIQENDFRVRYGSSTYVINEDTPGDDKWVGDSIHELHLLDDDC